MNEISPFIGLAVLGDVVVPILVIIVLVIINGIFVAAEFSLVASRRSRLDTIAETGSRAARWLVDIFDRPTGKDGYIAVAQLGITLASIGLGMYGEPAVAHWLYGPFESWNLSHAAAHTAGFVIALSAITYLHVVLGEMIPKALALQTPEQVSVGINPVMRLFSVVFRPMVAALNALALGMMRLLRIPEPDSSLSLYTSSELAIVTDEAAEGGQLGDMQRDLMRNVFDLDKRQADRIMTPRSEIVALDLSSTPATVIAQIMSSSISRYPVIDGDLDTVVGALHIKDYIRSRWCGDALDLADLMRPIPEVSADDDAEELLERFRRERTHIALVVDDEGATMGLVTMDDIVAEVMDDEVRSVD